MSYPSNSSELVCKRIVGYREVSVWFFFLICHSSITSNLSVIFSFLFYWLLMHYTIKSENRNFDNHIQHLKLLSKNEKWNTDLFILIYCVLVTVCLWTIFFILETLFFVVVKLKWCCGCCRKWRKHSEFLSLLKTASFIVLSPLVFCTLLKDRLIIKIFFLTFFGLFFLYIFKKACWHPWHFTEKLDSKKMVNKYGTCCFSRFNSVTLSVVLRQK